MPPYKSFKKKDDKKQKRSKVREPSKCRFCREKVTELDYKDLGTLLKLVSGQGKLFSRKRSGNCAAHQRSMKRAVKQARFIGLMPFCG
ncbi:30S ribosomal protein S18 [cyanobacterium TDX16]|jgi:small subunit ribosomal protein S18|nr:30S ribosomal protein S18 [cyanobacterium TDX16]